MKYLFIRIPKTASTSLVDILRKNGNFAQVYGNSLINQYSEQHETQLINEISNLLNNNKNKILSFGHISIDAIKSHNLFTSCDINIDDYFHFCFVRNPYDRIVSFYYYILSMKNTWIINGGIDNQYLTNFEIFVEYLKDHISPIGFYNGLHLSGANNQVDWITNKTKFIGRFESLEQDIDTILDIINIKNYTIPQKNKTDHQYYKNHYNNHTKKIVSKIYEKDLDLLKYGF